MRSRLIFFITLFSVLALGDVHDNFFSTYSTLRPVKGRIDASQADFVDVWRMHQKAATLQNSHPDIFKTAKSLYQTERERRLSSGVAQWLERDFPQMFKDPDFRIIYGEMIQSGGAKSMEAMGNILYRTLNKDLDGLESSISERRDALEQKSTLEKKDLEKSEEKYLRFAQESIAKVKNMRQTGRFDEKDPLIAAYLKAESNEKERLDKVDLAKDGDEEAKKWLLEHYSYNYLQQTQDSYKRANEQGDTKKMAQAIDAIKAIFKPVMQNGKIVDWVAKGFNFLTPEKSQVIRLGADIATALLESDQLNMALSFDQQIGKLRPLQRTGTLASHSSVEGASPSPQEKAEGKTSPNDKRNNVPRARAKKGDPAIGNISPLLNSQSKRKSTPSSEQGPSSRATAQSDTVPLSQLIDRPISKCISCHRSKNEKEAWGLPETRSDLQATTDDYYFEEMFPKTGYSKGSPEYRALKDYFSL